MALLLSVQASADPAPAPGPAPDGSAAYSGCGDPSIDRLRVTLVSVDDIVLSGVTVMSMGACDPDGCPPPTMDDAFCCCEETGTNQFSTVAGGAITFGG